MKARQTFEKKKRKKVINVRMILAAAGYIWRRQVTNLEVCKASATISWVKWKS